MSDSPKACRKAARTAGRRSAARPSTTGNVDEQAQASMQDALDPDAAGVSAYRQGMKRCPEDLLDMSSSASSGPRTKQCRLCGILSTGRNPFLHGKGFEKWGPTSVPWATGTPDRPVGRFCAASISTYSVAGFEDRVLSEGGLWKGM